MDDRQRRERAHRTVDALMDRLLAPDMPGFAALWAPDGTMTFPFATAPSPSHLDGRAAVADYLTGYNDLVVPRQVISETRHETGDPDTLVIEFAVTGHVVTTGAGYRMDYVAVITVGEFGVMSYRDYWSPAAAAAAMGNPTLVETAGPAR